jgi:phosphohistidine phosphatase
VARQLLILRHAKSSWDTAAATDFDRPLNPRGLKDAPRMGRWLRQQGLVPDWVLSSPAERARTTALLVCHELSVSQECLHWEPRIYEATTGDLLAVLSDCPAAAKTVLLVGHNPGLETLLQYLCDPIHLPPDGKLLPTATVARLKMPADWSELQPGAARLLGITRPAAVARD